MRRSGITRSTGWGALAACIVAGVATAQSAPVGIAILPFEDRGSYGQDKEVFRALELGIPSALATELSRHPGVRVADQTRVSQAVKGQNLAPNARVDAGTAARVGSQVGVRYSIAGNFADFYGSLRIDARIIETEGAQIIRVVSNSDPGLQDRADLFRIIRALAGKIEQAVNLPPAKSTDAAPIPTDALTQYSLGLLYESEGDRGRQGSTISGP